MAVPAWILATIGAAIFQVWRTALQARLRGVLPVGAAGFVRYIYALPIDALLLGGALLALHRGVPAIHAEFLLLCLIGGVGQIFGTILLIQAFAHRNFVVGTAYAKTEAAQLVVISVFFQGAHIAPLAIGGILLAVAGVFALSLAGQVMSLPALARASVQPAALCGLGAGTAFAITAVAQRGAALTLPNSVPIMLQAVLMLTITNMLQTLIQGGYMAWRTPADLRASLRLWRLGAPIGALSAGGSALWFAGFALTDVALVRGFGQIEILFTLAVGHFFLRERTKRGETAGLIMVSTGVVLIAVGGAAG